MLPFQSTLLVRTMSDHEPVAADDWILADNAWDDTGVWEDDDMWKD